MPPTKIVPAGVKLRVSRVASYTCDADVDAGLRCATVHLVGQTDRGTPHVVDKTRSTHQPADHVPGVDADPKAQVVTTLPDESSDDAAHLEGEFNAAMDAVQSWCDHATAGEITVVECANPFDAKGIGRRVELAEQIVDDSDQFVAG